MTYACIINQGFRKIDTDKWEFMNEGFVRGQRHLLRKIQRRKSHHSQQFDALPSPSNKAGKDALEGEIEGLRKERSSIMQEVVALQHEQLGTIQHIEVVKEKLEAAESRQKQMVSFLAKILQNPKFSGGLQKPSEKASITAPRPVRKFVKHSAYNSSPEAQTCLLQNSPVVGEEQMPSQIEDVVGDETAMVQELLITPEEDESVPIFRTVDPLLNGQDEMNSQLQPVNDYYISSGEDLWSMGFGGGDGWYSFSNEQWGNLSNYHEQEQSGLSDIWNIGSVKLEASSGIERWLDQDSPL